MTALAKRIARELQIADHYAVYEEDLNRVWPRRGKGRKAKIEQFAKKHGWRLRFYHEGLCAIFTKQPGPRTNRAR